MKVINIAHPESTYPDAIEAVCLKLAKDYRLHSTEFLPGQIQGTGSLMLFFEPKAKLKLLEFKARNTEKE
jgi:hypothetical protein